MKKVFKAERNYASFYALLREIKGADKEVMVYAYTNGRTESLREMTDEEYNAMLRGMRTFIEDEAKLKNARSKCLHQLQIYGVNTADWSAVDRFCMNPRIAGKKFSHLRIPDLVSLTRKMRAIIDKGDRLERQARLENLNAQIAQEQLKRNQSQTRRLSEHRS